ncbi:T9SS type A sorting domain-containing protein [Nonlabens sp.]|uniref:T9SS type A sorting domain-containing protein n=1 Tax=Nonlabens sp. TaxID=1888209 RepID=UPI001BD0982B|nr:T9SS type A sorting domain-containing protein [Nonlabens sp.]
MKKITFFLLLLVGQTILAQVTNEATPRGWDFAFKSQPLKIVMPPIDIEAIEQEDELTSQSLAKPYKFGEKIPVDLNLFNSGQWTELENGDRIWRLNIESTGARTINFLFDRYDLPVGAELFLYNNDHTDKIGPYTHKENQEDGVLGSWIIYGDNLWLEYYEPAAVKNQGRISIEQVVHGYRGFGKAEDDFRKLNESGSCNVDVQCNPNQGSTNGVDWTTIRDNYKDSVARIIINGNGLCTGSLVNNTDLDATPYFLTANHCLGNVSNGAGSSYNGNNWSFGFQWFTNTPQCATFTNTSGPFNPTRVLTGAVLRANDDIADFALFELNQSPVASWDLYYAGWNNLVNSSNGQLGMHHPSGDIMKLSRNDQAATTQNFNFNGNPATRVWFVADWDYGVTEGGSSGSCLLNTSGQIIGVLSGGAAACNGVNDNNQFDIYGRMDASWNSFTNNARRLSPWLDPANTASSFQNGAYASALSVASVDSLEINLYPNPSTGIINVMIENPADYRLYDLSGKLIRSGSFEFMENQLEIKDLSNGIYFLKVNDGKRTVTEKISKI